MIAPKKSERHFIRAWRKDRHLTQEQLGEKAELTQSQINQIELGKRGFSPESLERIADALKTTPGALLSGPPSSEKPPEILEFWDKATIRQRKQMLDIAKTLVGRED